MFPSSSTTYRTVSPPRSPQESARQDVINQARDAITVGNIRGAISNLRTKLGYDQHTFHNAILSLLYSSSSHHREELVKETLRKYPYFDLNAHSREGKTALDLAVRDDDVGFARYLLGKGAKPEKVSIASASGSMKALITAWRRTRQLYGHFNNRNNPGLTPLDHALRAGDFQWAREYLDGEIKNGKRMHNIWNEALAGRKKDVLRALLIAGKPEELRELGLVKLTVGEWQKALRDDPGLSAVLKEFPYQSAKRGSPENLNGKAHFASDARRQISCVHLATYHLTEQRLEPRRKFDYRKFGSPDEIARNVKLDIEQTWRAFKSQASEGHIVDNAKFGQFLVKQFEAIERENKRPRKMLLQSSNHLMNLTLMVKEKQGKKSYVVQFYNPSETTTNVRSRTGSLQTVETQLLEDYLRGGVAAIRMYYPETEGTSNKGKSLVLVQPEGVTQAGSASSEAPGVGRTLAAFLDPQDVDSSVIWHLMYAGFDGSLKQLREHFNSLSEDQCIELLSRKYGSPSKSAPALFASMQEGHANAIRVYGELLASISLERRIELLVGKNEQGNSALFIAGVTGKTEAIKAYGELLAAIYAEHNESRPAKRQKIDLNELPPLTFEEQFIDILAAKNANHLSALFIVMAQGTIETLDAYADLLKMVSPDKQAELLLAKICEGEYAGNNGLMIAIQRERFEIAARYISILNQLAPKLSANKRTELWNELQGCETHMVNAMRSLPFHQEARRMQQSFMMLKTALGG